MNIKTTLEEKKHFIQTYLCHDIPIENITLSSKRLLITDIQDNHIEISSNTFIRNLNNSLQTARREGYRASKDFVSEYQLQRNIEAKVMEEYPNHSDYIISNEDIAIIVPHKKGNEVIQYPIKKLLKK